MSIKVFVVTVTVCLAAYSLTVSESARTGPGMIHDRVSLRSE